MYLPPSDGLVYSHSFRPVRPYMLRLPTICEPVIFFEHLAKGVISRKDAAE